MEGHKREEDGKRVGPPPLPESIGKPLAPVPGDERYLTVDVLRGFALFGILIANMIFFSQPLEETGMRNGLWHHAIDKITDWFSLLLVEGKFYPLFSFLFGLGFAIQMDRAALRGKDLSGVFKRRLGILMFLGFCHAIFIWNGDVLFLYGLCGFGLLLFRNRKQKTTAIWAGLLISVPGVLLMFFGLLVMMLYAMPGTASEMRDAMRQDPESLYELNKAYVSGGYWDAVAYRAKNWFETTFYLLLFSPTFFGMFLVGLLAGKKGIFRDPEANKGLLVKVLLVCGIIGLALNFFGATTTLYGLSSEKYGFWFLGAGLITFGGPILALAYISGIVLFMKGARRLPIYEAIARTGRMSLTNYLLQSVIATTVFYSHGLGLGDTMGRLETIVLAVFIFATQVVCSYFWFQKFRFGPMEWVWRSATYAKAQPMRLG